MSVVNFRNLTSNSVALDLQVLNMQGQHVSVRASLPAGTTTAVTLPKGVTLDMLMQSPQVQADLSAASPKYSVSLPTTAAGVLPGALAAYEVLRFTQAVAADVTTPGILLGTMHRAGSLSRIRLWGESATILAETYKVTAITKNGVSIGTVPANSIQIPASTAALTVTTVDLVALLGNVITKVSDGDVIGLVVDYTNPGAGTLANVHLELRTSHA